MLNKQKTTRRQPRLRETAEEFVEQIGLIMEIDGHSRIAGRLVGLLLLTDGATSLDDLARQLRVSKPSVSVNARLLEQKGVVERVSHAGDRRDFYRIADDLIGRTTEQRLARLRRLGDAVAVARSSIPLTSQSVAARLDELSSGCEHVRRVTEQALDDWRGRTNGHRAARSAGTRKR